MTARRIQRGWEFLPIPSIGQLPLEDIESIDAACDAFANSWKAGDKPKIEEALEDVDDRLQPILVVELSEIDIEHRIQSRRATSA